MKQTGVTLRHFSRQRYPMKRPETANHPVSRSSSRRHQYSEVCDNRKHPIRGFGGAMAASSLASPSKTLKAASASSGPSSRQPVQRATPSQSNCTTR